MSNTLEKDILEFAELSVKQVDTLRKQAVQLREEKDRLQERVDSMQEALDSQEKTASERTIHFPEKRLVEVVRLIKAAGVVDSSEESLLSTFREHPEKVLDMFEKFASADYNFGDLTNIKPAGQDFEGDVNKMWREATKN